MHEDTGNLPAIVGLAGRRVDAEGTDTSRFPLANVPLVRQRLGELLLAENAVALICSAACGADLVALEEAERLGIRRRIVLPFGSDRFRESSVVDRPGDWGPIFDRLITAAASSDDLVVLDIRGDDDRAYAAANEAIIREARVLAHAMGQARRHRLVALLVWEGAPRQGSDATASFGELARNAGFEEIAISTL